MAFLAGFLALGATRAPENPLDAARCRIESVTALNGPVSELYRLRPPFRVVRDGRAVLDRLDAEEPRWPVIRIDLTVTGERVIVFARTTAAPAHTPRDTGP
jgi:hypothetical protein